METKETEKKTRRMKKMVSAGLKGAKTELDS